MKIINQMVDTLKLHYYPSQDLTENEIKKYNTFLDDLKEAKEKAQAIINHKNDHRFIEYTIDKKIFHVMATSVRSFSVFLQSADITIALKSITDKSSNPIIKIEFRSEYLARYGYVYCINQVNKIITSFLPRFEIKVSEIHLATDIQGYDFTAMDRDRFSFRNRTLQDFDDIANTLFTSGTKKTGFSFGKDDFMMRVYDKTHQIKLNKHAGYVQPLRWEINPNYDKSQKVWRIEFQFRREYLKTLVGSDGILDGFENVLNAIPDLWKHARERFVHYDLPTDHCIECYTGEVKRKNGKIVPLTKETIKKRKQKAGESQLWELIHDFNNTESNVNIEKFNQIKMPEVEYVVNSFKGVVSTFVKLTRGNFSKEDLLNIIIESDEKEINKTGFSILDNARLKTVKHLNDMKKLYIKNGVVIDGYEDYKNDLKQNLKTLLSSIENRPYAHALEDEIIKRGTFLYQNRGGDAIE